MQLWRKISLPKGKSKSVAKGLIIGILITTTLTHLNTGFYALEFFTSAKSNNVVLNNFGDNSNVPVIRRGDENVTYQSDFKTILMWNDAYGTREYDIGFGREPFIKFMCPENRCMSTSNRSFLNNVKDFDALIIHQRGIEWNDMPSERSPQQRYIFWVMESAQYPYMDISTLNGYFNWTMTYRMKSDLYRPYGYVHRTRDHPEGQELEALVRAFGLANAAKYRKRGKGPSKAEAAWFVSNCGTESNREKYVERMEATGKFTAAIYGDCGKLSCPRGPDDEKCYEMAATKYRFYLSFENSLCEGYVTEKFFNVMKYDIVPVVFGGTDYSTIAPYKSYINAAHYTPKQLVKLLLELSKDDAKYAEYFWWKPYYEVRQRREDKAQAYCDLCRRLHDPKEPPKTYHDMHDWWITGSNCTSFK